MPSLNWINGQTNQTSSHLVSTTWLTWPDSHENVCLLLIRDDFITATTTTYIWFCPHYPISSRCFASLKSFRVPRYSSKWLRYITLRHPRPTLSIPVRACNGRMRRSNQRVWHWAAGWVYVCSVPIGWLGPSLCAYSNAFGGVAPGHFAMDCRGDSWWSDPTWNAVSLGSTVRTLSARSD